jgi:exodeoxyribonuclease VII small subunit
MSNKSFEKSLERLEEIVAKMESGELSLDEAMGCYEEGIKLSRFCYAKLAEAEKKIEKLVKKEDKEGKERLGTEELDLFKDGSDA